MLPAAPAAAAPWPGHPDRSIVRHVVRPGDTATGLAVRYHAWTAELIRLNRLGAKGTLLPGPGAADPGRALRRTPAPAARSRKPRATPRSTRTTRKHQRSPAGCCTAPPRRRGWLHADLTRDQVRRLVAADGPALRRTAEARARHRLAGVRLAAAARLQRRRHRRDAGDAGHRPLDAVVRRSQAAPARHPRQRAGRRPDPADAAGVDRYDNNAIAAYYQGLGAVRRHGYFDDTKHVRRASVRAHQRRIARTGSPI